MRIRLIATLAPYMSPGYTVTGDPATADAAANSVIFAKTSTFAPYASSIKATNRASHRSPT